MLLPILFQICLPRGKGASLSFLILRLGACLAALLLECLSEVSPSPWAALGAATQGGGDASGCGSVWV